MSETRKKVSLDAALGAWPDVEKSEADWEEKARSVEARVRAGDRGATAGRLSDDELLSAPLGQMPEDGHNSASPEIQTGKGAPMTMQDRERDRRSLQDLAKLAQMTPPPPSVSSTSGVQRAAEAKKDDSGIVDLAAAAAADPGAEQRAQSTPLASQGLFDDEPASVRPPALAQQPYPSVPPVPASVPPISGHAMQAPMPAMTPSAPVVAPISSAPFSQPQAPSVISSQMTAMPAKKKNGQVIAILIGGVVAAAAVAAGVVVFAKHKQAADAAALAAATPKTEAPATKVEEPKKAEPAQVVADNTPAAEPTADPTPATTSTKIGGPAKPAAAAVKGGGGALAAAPAAPKNEELKLSQKDLPQNAGGAQGDLGAAIGAAVGPKDAPQQTPAAATNGPQFAPGSVPQKPSQGAITGAIGSVLPGARACLGPDDPVTYATITFASAGSVQSVALSGGSASKASAASCIKDALSKAKVAPFAEATYVTRVPVRP